MKKILFLLAMLPMMWACQDDCLNKSIIEPISVEQISMIAKEKPEFIDMYNAYLENILLTKSDSAKYSAITYGKLLDFYKVQKKIDAHEYTKKYYELGKQYQLKADSIVDEWITHLNENKISESDSIKAIFDDYKGIIEARKKSSNAFSRMSYALKRSQMITKVIDEDYLLMPEAFGNNVARKQLIELDSLCYDLFIKTKAGESYQDAFIWQMKNINK